MYIYMLHFYLHNELVVGAVSRAACAKGSAAVRMEVTGSLQGECGYCGGRVGEEAGGEGWLPLQCSSCQQLFHIGCLKVS